MRPSFLFIAFLPTVLLGQSGPSAIHRDGDIVCIQAGILEKRIRLTGANVISESLTVTGSPVAAAQSGELSFQISRATPDRNPLDLLGADSNAVGVKVADAMAGGTDALKIKQKQVPADKSGVTWTDARTFTSATWQAGFGQSMVNIYDPAPGVHRLLIRTRATSDALLADVSIYQIYETYDAYPVIRKWVEFHNNGTHWLKLDNLVVDALRLAPDYSHRTALTPSERGATSCLLAAASADQARGVIVASEVPSALRQIRESGESGYNPEHFEWVLGPAETFVSEASFIFGFAGNVIKTPSATSYPLDRAVEGPFKAFLRERLGISPTHHKIPAPQWASWSNFGPNITDAIMREQADIAAKCGFTLFEIDDGWQSDRFGTIPHPKTFPDFDATCDYVRSKGMSVGLWVSCFRSRGAPDFKALPGAACQPLVSRRDGLAMSFASNWRDYYTHDLIRLRDRYGATYFKQDFTNIKFGDLAAGHESRTRKESLLRGLRGLLESQALLRRLAPDVANEITHEIYWGTPGTPCDLAAIKSCAVYHVPPNDYSGSGHTERVGASPSWNKYSTEKMRADLVHGCLNARNRFFAHRGLPLECIEYYGAATVNWKGSLTPQVQDRQICSWLMGAPMPYSGDLASLTPENIAHYRKRFDLIKRLESSYGIYRNFQFSGVPTPTDSGWHWWGKLDPQGMGAVVVLRGSHGADSCVVNIPWVDPATTYRVVAQFQDKELGRFTGTDLQAGKLTLALPVYGQEILELTAAPKAVN